MPISPEGIEAIDRHMDREVERMKHEKPWIVEEYRRYIEGWERANPDLSKHSHRLAPEALHPESKTGE
jgi:hypothetical protein